MRRFISPDDTAYLDPESVNGLNLYCYCNNDPVNYCDPSGHSIIATLLITLGVIGVVGGLGYAAYTDYQDNYDIDGSIGWQRYVGYSLIGGAIGAGIGFTIGYFGPALASYLGGALSALSMPPSLALASGGALCITGTDVLIVSEAIGIAILFMAYESKKAAPRIKSNTKKEAYEKAFQKGGKKKPILHSNGKYGPHFHPVNPKFKHWHYYFSFILGALGIELDN